MTLKLEDAVTAMALVGTRVSGLLVFAPVLGSSAIAPRIKAGLVIPITALLYPVCGPRDLALTPPALARVMLGEMLIGVLLGLAVQLVFDAAEFAGQLVGMQVGYSLVNVLDPNTQVETPVVSVFMQMLVTVLFLQMDVHRWLLRSLAASFRYLPAGSAAVNGQLVHALLHAAGGIWLAGVQLAAPVAYRNHAGRPGHGVPRKGVAAITGAVSRIVGQEHGRPFGSGIVPEILAGNV